MTMGYRPIFGLILTTTFLFGGLVAQPIKWKPRPRPLPKPKLILKQGATISKPRVSGGEAKLVKPPSTPSIGGASGQARQTRNTMSGQPPRVGSTLGTRATVPGAQIKSSKQASSLKKQLASQDQMGQAGAVFAGAGTKKRFRGAGRAARVHGGSSGDWSKKSSTRYRSDDGLVFETHWLENRRTAARREFKTVFPRKPKK